MALSGCFVQSIHPFYTDAARIAMPQVFGEWDLQRAAGENVATNGIKPWTFSDGGKTNCTILVHDKENTPANISAVFFKVANRTYCDFTAGDPENTKLNAYWVWNLRAIHTVYQVDAKGDDLKLKPMDYEWFTKAVEKGEIKVPMIKEVGNDDALPLFTATPQEWEKILSKHGGTASAFSDQNSFVLKRRASPKQEGAKP